MKKHLTHKPKTENTSPPLNRKGELAGLACLLAALALFCAVVTPILVPKRHDYGATWGYYADEPENTVDMLVLGSSLCYCDLVPAVVYEETGVRTYLMSGPSQTFPVTYRYLRECLKTQSPKTVLIECTGLLYEPDNQFVKANLTYMPYWSTERLIPVLEESKGTERLGLLFPMYAYHERWNEVGRRDVKEGLLGYGTDPYAGYTFLPEATVLPGIVPRGTNGGMTEDEGNYQRNINYARLIQECCDKNGIKAVFYLTPISQRLSEEWLARFQADIEGFGGTFVDFNDDFDEMGFDLSMDFYDQRHLNYRGAEKFSRWLSPQLGQWGAAATGEGSALWQQRVEAFAARRDATDSQPPVFRTEEGV